MLKFGVFLLLAAVGLGLYGKHAGWYDMFAPPKKDSAKVASADGSAPPVAALPNISSVTETTKPKRRGLQFVRETFRGSAAGWMHTAGGEYVVGQPCAHGMVLRVGGKMADVLPFDGLGRVIVVAVAQGQETGAVDVPGVRVLPGRKERPPGSVLGFKTTAALR